MSLSGESLSDFGGSAWIGRVIFKNPESMSLTPQNTRATNYHVYSLIKWFYLGILG